jgi:AAA+ ATPase superfamily predicted ATPase
MFVNRKRELAFLNDLVTRRHPGPAQLVLLYGRRRVGKTVLLHTWAQRSDLPFIYWAAEKETAPLQRRKLYAHLLGVPFEHAPIFASWAELWQAAAALLRGQRRILILDELPYAAEADPAMLSALQHAWDQQFKASELIIVLCGSHVRTMETLLARQSPLFGRMTGQWLLEPLAFSALALFFPTWSAEERVALYGMVGGVPAYLEWLDPTHSLVENIRHVVLAPGSMFVAEPQFLLYDEVREPQTYLAILKAIGRGRHTLNDISNASLVGKAHLSTYLATLQSLRLVERRLPVTIPPARRRKSRQGRYHFSDPYFRFYFRFIDPYQAYLPTESERLLAGVKQGLRAFVGQTAFEQLAQEWLRKQGRAGMLPFEPEAVGSHWSRRVQVDAVAINWQTRDILLGECKWTEAAIDRRAIRELVAEKTPKVLKDLESYGEAWRVHYALFARRGFTEAARAYAEEQQALLVDLARLDNDLRMDEY